MDLIEFVEKILGIKLTMYQKKMLNIFVNLPEGCHIVMGRKGPMIIDSNGEKIEMMKERFKERV